MSATPQPPPPDAEPSARPEGPATEREPIDAEADDRGSLEGEGTRWWRWGLAGLAGLGPGLGAWALTRADRSAWLLSNQLPPTEGPRFAALGWALVSLVVVGALASLARRRGWTSARRWRAAALPAAAPLLALVMVPGLETSAPRLTMTLVMALAVLAGVGSAAIAAPWVEWIIARPRAARLRWLPAALVGVGTVGMAVMLRHLALVRHHALGSRSFDLGIFDNLLYQASLGRWQVTTFMRGESFTSAHASPVWQLLAPLYWVSPGPSTLLGFQTLWVASGAIPLYRLAVHRLGRDGVARWVGAGLAMAYLMHPSMHGAALFDAHALVLAAPLVLWALDALHREQWRRYAVFVGLLVFVREDVPFVVMGVGLHAALTLGHRRAGALTLAAAAGGLAIMKLGLMAHPDLFMPDTASTYRYTNRFRGVIPDLESGGAGDIVMTVLANPGFVIQHALTGSKLTCLAVMAVPCAGLCVVQARAWLPMAFGLVFVLLGTGASLHNPYIHYAVFLFPVMLAAAVEGARVLLRRGAAGAPAGQRAAARRRRAVGLVVALAVAAGLMGDTFGALTDSTAFRAGPAKLKRQLAPEERERYAWLREQVDAIGPDASVSASNTMGPHVSTRSRAYHFADHPEADWIVLRLPDLTKPEVTTMRRLAKSGRYTEVAAWGSTLVVWRRRSTTSPPGSEAR